MNPSENPPSTIRATGRTPAKKKGAWRKWISPLLLGALVVAIVAGLIPKPLEVDTATLGTGPMSVTVLEEGKTRIRHRYVISPPLSGFLHRIALRPGDPIVAGKTVLAEIQPELPSFLNPRSRAEAEARTRAAEAARMRSEATLESVRDRLDLAQKELARATVLKTKGAISASEWDNADSQVAVLQRELRAAEFGLKVAQFELAQAEAAQMPVDGAQTTNVTAPFQILAPVNGFVLNVFEESARIVLPGTPLMEVGDPTDLECEIELLSSDAVGVKPGAEVSIERWGGDKPLKGTVSLVEPGAFTKISALGIEEQRVRVRVNFLDPPPLLGDRYRVEARILIWHSQNVLQIPTGALFRRGNDWLTFMVESNSARAVKVTIGRNNGISAEILSGLQAGQVVVLHPPDALSEGSSIRPRATRH